ncbi:MAG: aminotransferase class III-fold pyridoxal phosphate-dependent enzyme [Pseudomonadota bacterium]
MTSGLSPLDTMAMHMVAGASPKVRELFQRLAERQSGSADWQRRCYEASPGSPSTLAFEAPVLPLCVERADGGRIWDVDGNEYIDCHMGYTAGVLGHNPPAVAKVVNELMPRGLGAGHFFPEQVELAELVKEMVPGADRVSMFHTGGEAIAAAVRMARATRGKMRVAKFEGCYHGSRDIGLHNTWMILSGMPPGDPVNAITPSVATGGLPTRGDDEFMVLAFNDPSALERIRAEADSLACIVCDPTPVFASPWLDGARQFVRELALLASELDVPLILDEIVCGFRIAKGGARQWAEIEPAMSCFGKITSGLGVPMSMVVGDSRYVDAARTAGMFRDYGGNKVWAASTMSCNFVAVISALAQMRYLDDNHDDVLARLDRNHARLAEQIAEIGQRRSVPICIQGNPRLQMQLSFSDHADVEPSYRGMMQDTSPAEFMKLIAFTFYLRENGVYMKAIPSMNLSAGHTDADIDGLAGAIDASIGQMTEDGVL